MTDDDMTTEEAEKYLNSLSGLKMGEDPKNIFAFLQDLMKSEKTTKAGNVTEIELGMGTQEIRSCLDTANFCDVIKTDNNDLYGLLAERMRTKAEIMLSTSLSKEGKLLDIAQTRKSFTKNIGALQKKRSWFSRKPDAELIPEGY